jgi:hypothetical protein
MFTVVNTPEVYLDLLLEGGGDSNFFFNLDLKFTNKIVGNI